MIKYILCGIIILQALAHHFERRDLYNRIMSKNLAEYKSGKAPSVVSAHNRVLNKWRGKDGDK